MAHHPAGGRRYHALVDERADGALVAGAPAWALRNAGHTAFIFHLYTEASIYLEDLCSSRMNCHMPPTLLHLASSLFAASVSCVLDEPARRLLHARLPQLAARSIRR